MSDEKWLIWSDMQMPYQDDKAVKLVYKIGKWLKPDVVVNIGDAVDLDGPSRWNEGSVDEVLNGVHRESKLMKEYWAKHRELWPNSQLHWLAGNHEQRLGVYLSKKAPALLEVVTDDVLYDTTKNGVKTYPYENLPELKMNEVYFHHGMAASKHAGDSVRSDMESWGVSLVRGHSHRCASIFKTFELKNETLQGHEIGHLTDASGPGFKYTQVHNWQQGFAIGFKCDNGQDVIQTIRINPDYTCYVGNRKFSV